MLTKVEVRTPQGNLLSLSLDEILNGYIVEEITGLDPVKATLVSSGFATLDGEQYQSAKREKRNIVITLGLEPDYTLDQTVRELRSALYGFFMPKFPVSLRFFTADDLEVDIAGVVESCEAAMFTQEPQTIVSIVNFDPDFLAVAPTVFEGETVADATEELIEYNGTVDTGMKLTLHVDRSVSEFTLYHRVPDGSTRTLQFAANLVVGDELTISTVRGDKYATLVRTGTSSSVLFAVSPQSNWTELVPGDNNIRVYAEGDPIPYDITYTTRYGAL